MLIEAKHCAEAVEKPSRKLQKERQQPIQDRDLVVMSMVDGTKDLLPELPKIDTTEPLLSQRKELIDHLLWYCPYCRVRLMETERGTCRSCRRGGR